MLPEDAYGFNLLSVGMQGERPGKSQERPPDGARRGSPSLVPFDILLSLIQNRPVRESFRGVTKGGWGEMQCPPRGCMS
jgi:hypothetical protein